MPCLKPISLSCGHSGCLVSLRQLTKSTSTLKCPMRQREFQASTISFNSAIDQITSELAVECQSQGCDWKGKYARARAHQNQCHKLLVQTRDAHSVRLEKKCCSTENLAARGRSPAKIVVILVWDSSQEHKQFQCIMPEDHAP